jgi:hypothetical protein
MAHVNFDGLNLRITLAAPERRAVHVKEFVVPRAHIASVRHAPDIWVHVRQDIGVMGLGYPRMVLWGTAYNRTGKDFCVLHKEGPGLVIDLAGHPYDRVLLSMPDSQSWPLFARLREITAQPGPDGP